MGLSIFIPLGNTRPGGTATCLETLIRKAVFNSGYGNGNAVINYNNVFSCNGNVVSDHVLQHHRFLCTSNGHVE